MINKYLEKHPGADIEYLPSGIDLHVHFREPGLINKETMETGLNTAHAGGTTTVVDMPNTIPVTDTLDTLNHKLSIAEKNRGILLAGGLTDKSVNSGEIVKIANKTKILKAFLADSTGNLKIEWNHLIRGIKLLENRTLIMFHAEHSQYIKNRTEESLELDVRPIKAEVESIKQVLELANEFPEQLFHVTHVSSFDGAKLLVNQNEVSWDVLPKYLQFTTDLVNTKGNFAKMNPPLRTNHDLEGLLQLFFQGKIPMLTSDHAPHTVEEKQKTVAGAPGVQELYYFALDHYLRGNISKEILMDVVHDNPKKILEKVGIQPLTRRIAVDRQAKFTLAKDKIISKCRWSLWEDFTFHGKIIGFL